MNRRTLLSTLAGAVTLAFFAPKAQAATTHRVEIKGFKFRPKELSVAVGDRIQFENSDGAPHSATADNKSWDTGVLSGGQSAEITVTEGMGDRYFCKIHPNMRGKLTITG